MARENPHLAEDIAQEEISQVMTKPLPQILGEMEANIKLSSEAARRAEDAARAARGAAGAAGAASLEAAKRAEEARQAGESAADAATQAAFNAAEKAEEIAKAARKAAEIATKKADQADKETRQAAKTFKKTIDAAIEFVKRTVDVELIKADSIRTEMEQRIESLEYKIKIIESALPRQKTVVLREITKDEAKSEIKNLFKRGDTLYYSDVAEKLSIDLELVVEICDELIQEGKIKIADRA